MEIRTEFFKPEEKPFPFEGAAFSGRMNDGKLGAYCKSGEFCLIAGAGDFREGRREMMALGRWNGEKYSVLNRVPPPFIIRPSSGIAGKSSVAARNIVNRLCRYMAGDEKALFREYLLEQERCGIAYAPG